jgi:RNA polymerase sigma-70 factor, ECF subfamily
MQGSRSETTPDAATDAQLALRIAGRADAPAHAEEAELYRRFAPRVRLYGLRHLRGEAAAADLVQHVMTLTFEKLRGGAVREPERIASFVLGTARLAACDLRRAEGRRRETQEPVETAAELLAVQPPEPLDADALGRCLQELAERERTVVVLTYYDEQTAGQIASQLGTTEGNVRVVRHRALGRLQRCLGLAGETP